MHMQSTMILEYTLKCSFSFIIIYIICYTQYILRCAVVIKKMSEAKVFTVFLVRLLQLPVIKTTSHNVILYVSVLGSRSHFMHVSDMICTVQASGKVNGSRDVSAAQKGPIRVRTSMDLRIVSRTSAAAARPTAGRTRTSADSRMHAFAIACIFRSRPECASRSRW